MHKETSHKWSVPRNQTVLRRKRSLGYYENGHSIYIVQDDYITSKYIFLHITDQQHLVNTQREKNKCVYRNKWNNVRRE